MDIPSISGNEGDVGRFLVRYLEELGYWVELQTVEGDRANVIATTRAPARVVLSTHMDTVPPFISSSEDEHFIYGRGACDAKGIIAAQITAAERLRSLGMQDIGLLFTVDEEQGRVVCVVQHGAAAGNVLIVLALVFAILYVRSSRTETAAS